MSQREISNLQCLVILYVHSLVSRLDDDPNLE